MNTETEELQNESSSEAEESENDEKMQSSNESDADSDNAADEVDSDGADNEFDENEESGDEGDEGDEGNAGWADAFSKVLQQQKPKNKKYLVLSKAKKLSEQKVKNDAGKKLTFEIADKVDDDEEEEEEDVKPNAGTEEPKPSSNELELALIARKERNNKLQQLRVKPDSMDRERERSFKRIATKGVVQLFNAVRSQQRDLVDRLDKAGPLDHKRDEVLNNINKRQFLDMLMGGKRAQSENVDNLVKDEDIKDEDSSKPSQWSVLRDDFMTSKKLKHWDKEDDNESDDQANNDDDMDSDSD